MAEDYASGLLTGLMKNSGVDPGLLALMNDKDHDHGFGDGAGWWVLILFFLILGGGRGMFGANAEDVAKNSTVINEANYTRLMDALNTQGSRQEMAIGNLANSIGCDIGAVKSALAGLDKNLALTQGDIKSAIQNCCCNIRTEMQSLNAQTNLVNAQNHNDIVQRIQDTRYLISTQGAAQDASIAQRFADQNAYLAQQFCAIKNREDQREIQQLRDKLQEQREQANTLAILNAISNKDTVTTKLTGTLNSTAGTWEGSGLGSLN